MFGQVGRQRRVVRKKESWCLFAYSRVRVPSEKGFLSSRLVPELLLFLMCSVPSYVLLLKHRIFYFVDDLLSDELQLQAQYSWIKTFIKFTLDQSVPTCFQLLFRVWGWLAASLAFTSQMLARNTSCYNQNGLQMSLEGQKSPLVWFWLLTGYGNRDLLNITPGMTSANSRKWNIEQRI